MPVRCGGTEQAVAVCSGGTGQAMPQPAGDQPMPHGQAMAVGMQNP